MKKPASVGGGLVYTDMTQYTQAPLVTVPPGQVESAENWRAAQADLMQQSVANPRQYSIHQAVPQVPNVNHSTLLNCTDRLRGTPVQGLSSSAAGSSLTQPAATQVQPGPSAGGSSFHSVEARASGLPPLNYDSFRNASGHEPGTDQREAGSYLHVRSGKVELEEDDPVDLRNFEKTEPATISWRNINFSVQHKTKDANGNKVVGTKQILQDVSGVVKPGEMLAICGPSGGGKTTLLDAIAGRIDGRKRGRQLGGQVCINGRPRDSNFKKIASYVQQEFALQTPFTVKETMGYAADLLLPHSKYSAQKRREMADEVIHVLGLDSCKNTIVGDVFRKGLSGGQLRRLSIAIELIGNPGILLLDEPTSGLDSTAAENIMKYLQRLARSGRTVICTIHQPPTEVWNSFDKFCLLSQGKCLYFGPAEDSTVYFEAVGHPCPLFSNPADHFLRLANTDFDGHADIDHLAQHYATSTEGQDLQLAIAAAAPDCHSGRLDKFERMAFQNGFFAQFATLAHRAFMNNAKNPGIFLVRLIMYTGLGAMIGFMFWKIGDRLEPADIVARTALLFYVAAFLVFMSVAVLPFFILERHVFLCERANGWYSVGSYVLATFLMSLPGLALIAIVSTLLVVLPAGLKGFGVFFLDLLLSLITAEAYMAVVGAVVPHYIIGIAMGAATYGFFMLCEGFMILRPDIPPWFIWGHYLGFHTYSFRAFIVNEFDNLGALDSPQFATGHDVVVFYDMHDWPIWKDLTILAGYAIGLQLIYFLILQTFHTGKR